MQKSIEEMIAYGAFDAIKAKGMPANGMIIEDVIVPPIYHMVAKQLLAPLDKFLLTIDATLKEELVKFVVESALLMGSRYLMKEDDYKQVWLKQLISQAGVFVYRKATSQI